MSQLLNQLAKSPIVSDTRLCWIAEENGHVSKILDPAIFKDTKGVEMFMVNLLA